MERDAILVLDLGSSSLKGALVSRTGAVLGEASAAYPTHAPAPGRQEQDPEDWWRALGEVARALTGADSALPDAAAVVLTGTMQNLVPVDEGGRPMGPAILYSDGRIDASRLAALRRRLPADHEARIGNAADAAQPVFKRLAGEGAGAAVLHVGAKDALIHRLTGVRVIDPTTATTSGLMSLARGDWDDDILAASGMERARLPRIAPADAVVGRVTADAAARTGLPEDLPVICGCGDAGASVWGAGVEAQGAQSVYLGTSGWVAMSVPMPRDLPRPHYTLAAPVGDGAIAIAPILTAGAALDWIAARLGLSVGAALDAARGADPEQAPLFLPYLLGERSPFEDRSVRAALWGLDASHDAGAIAWAAVEGIAHAVRHCREALGPSAGAVTATGGAAEAPLVRQVLADVLGAEVRPVAHPRLATALGAARIGWRALGAVPPPAALGDSARPAKGSRARVEMRYRAHVEASGMARRLAAIITPKESS